MIPRISKGGRGFSGAKAYYLNDKGTTETQERVGFVELVNLPHNDRETPQRNAERGFAVMSWTAMHQAEIKAAAGTKATGRALEKPVYTYSLSWHADDRPSDDHMREAAFSSLKALKMDHLQAVIVRHNDRPNCPHCHVIVNRVDPKTGKAASTSRDHLILSKWAQEWERQHGLTVVKDRVRNNGLRAQEAAKPKEVRAIIKAENLSREEYARMLAYRTKTPSMVREQRAAQQSADRAQLAGVIERREINAKRAIVSAYGNSRDLLSQQIVDLQTRMDRKGLFASIVKFKRRLTGELAQDQRTLTGLQKSRDDLDRRVAERLDLVKKQNDRDRTALERRHKAELERDERYIAWRSSGTRSQSSSGLHPKSVRTRADIGARFVPHRVERASMALDHGTAATEPQRTAPSPQTEAEPRSKRYSRAEGRGSGRTEGRTRNRTRNKDRELGD